MEGDTEISSACIERILRDKGLPIRVHHFIAHGSFGVVFAAVLAGIPVVVKAALTKPREKHTLLDEWNLYEKLHMCHPYNTRKPPTEQNLPTPDGHVATGWCYFYDYELVPRKNIDLKPKTAAEAEKLIQFLGINSQIFQSSARSQECLEYRHSSDVGICLHNDCKVCQHKYFKLHFLVMSRFGKSLKAIAKEQSSRTFSVPTTAKLVLCLLRKLQWFHERGMVHRDLKPANISVRYPDKDSRVAQVYLLDFGLSKAWRTDSGYHIPFRKKNHSCGTIHFIGIHAHKGHEASRRDDLQSLAIMGLEWLQGTMPWDEHQQSFKKRVRNLPSENKKFREYKIMRHRHMLRSKKEYIENIHNHLANSGLPREFRDFMAYTNQLGFDEDPDYGRWIAHFERLINSRQWAERNLDWHKSCKHSTSTVDRDNGSDNLPEETIHNDEENDDASYPRTSNNTSSSSGASNSSSRGNRHRSKSANVEAKHSENNCSNNENLNTNHAFNHHHRHLWPQSQQQHCSDPNDQHYWSTNSVAQTVLLTGFGMMAAKAAISRFFPTWEYPKHNLSQQRQEHPLPSKERKRMKN